MNTLSDLSSRLSQGASSAASSLDDSKLIHRAGAKAHTLVDRLSGRAHDVVGSLEAAAETVEPHGRRWYATTQSYVKTNPFKSLAIAVAAGMLARHFVRR